MYHFPCCMLLLAIAFTEAVYDYRDADNRVADGSITSNTRYNYQPWPPPTTRPDADQVNYIERTPQHYQSVRYPGWRRRQGTARTHGGHSTTGLLRTSQRGSVRIPYRGAVVPVPVIVGGRKPYRATVTTTVVSSEEFNGSQNSIGLPARDAPVDEGVCVRCPVDKTVVASRGVSYVLMERSKLRRCRRRPKVPGAKFEILYGPQPGSVLTEGIHTVVGRAMFRHTELMRCQYSYQVIVRKCSPLMLPSLLEARCSQGSVWGSRCRLSCRQGYKLEGNNVTECGGDLQWTSSLPTCTAETGCAQPMTPDHGILSCQSRKGESATDLLPEGSVCRYECVEGFAVPATQTHLLVTSCTAGQWNNSVDASCVPLVAHPTPDDSSEIAAFQSDSVYHTVRLRRRRNRHPVTKRPEADPCSPSPCQGGGTCLIGPHHQPVLCLCPAFREGQFCEREVCSKDICKNGGKCLMYGSEATCYCRQGFSGSHCEIQGLG